MKIKEHISKEEISAIDKVASFDGEIVLIETEEVAEKAIRTLAQEQVVGFDTETRPSFTRGENNEVALIQIATLAKAYLFRVNLFGIIEPLARFIEDHQVLKVGLSLLDDFRAMRRRYHGLDPQGFVDLQKICPAYGIKDQSLRSIYAILFNERMSKQARLTNWEMKTLSDKAIDYAALDAYACLRIYFTILSLPQPEVFRFGLVHNPC